MVSTPPHSVKFLRGRDLRCGHSGGTCRKTGRFLTAKDAKDAKDAKSAKEELEGTADERK
jgi:hypothetical protein